MSERTPQDVLRELRVIIGRPSSGTHFCWATDKLARARRLIDEAIAEAPDTLSEKPETPNPSFRLPVLRTTAGTRIVDNWPYQTGDGDHYDRTGVARLVEAVETEAMALATLSEKPGLDVERLQRIAAAADFRASVKFDKGWHGPDLLDGVAAWMDRIDEERGQPDHSVQTDMRRWAKELRAALGSTDSKGR